MGRAPSFTESELRRAIKVAAEESLSVRVEKTKGKATIVFDPIDDEKPNDNPLKRFGGK